MKAKIALLTLFLSAALGAGCGGAAPEGGIDDPMVSPEGVEEVQEFAGDQDAEKKIVSSTWDGSDPQGTQVASTETMAKTLTSPVSEDCRLTEEGGFRRHLSRGGVVLAQITYVVTSDGIFSKINEAACGTDVVTWEDADGLCHAAVICGGREYDYYVDASNQDAPRWILEDGANRWDLEAYTGTLPQENDVETVEATAPTGTNAQVLPNREEEVNGTTAYYNGINELYQAGVPIVYQSAYTYY